MRVYIKWIIKVYLLYKSREILEILMSRQHIDQQCYLAIKKMKTQS